MGPQVTNTEQALEWETTKGEHWVAHQERYDRLLGEYGDHLLAAAEIGDTDVVLDVGCGNGATTREAARVAASGSALGVDLSGPMLERARHLAAEAGLDNVFFERADAQVNAFEAERFTRAISRFGIMFFSDPVAAFANIAGALRPGSRLSFTCWRDVTENEYLMVPGAAALEFVDLPDMGDSSQPGAYSLASQDRIRSVLGDAGLTDVAVEALDLPISLGADAADTVDFFLQTGIARDLLGDVDQVTMTKITGAVTAAFQKYETADGVVLGSAAWLVTATRP